MRKMSLVLRGALLAATCNFSSLASAAWVGVTLFSPAGGSDHIHLVVSDDNAPQEGAILNLWQGRATPQVFSQELYLASNFLVFHSERSKEELVNYWNEFFEKVKFYRNIVTHNCADASDKVLSYALGFPLIKKPNMSRLIFFFNIPNVLSPIRLPESVFNQTEGTLKAKEITYYSLRDFREFTQLKGMSDPSPMAYELFFKSLSPTPPALPEEQLALPEEQPAPAEAKA